MRNNNKKRVPLKTILLYCEGACEYALSLHLKDLFHQRGSGFIVTVVNGHGGSPLKTVEKAMKDDGFDEKYVWIDTDRPEIEEARVIASQNGILIIENITCIESELLKVTRIRIKGVTDHKSVFKRQYPELDLTDKKSYVLFLNEAAIKFGREQSTSIDQIINILKEGRL